MSRMRLLLLISLISALYENMIAQSCGDYLPRKNGKFTKADVNGVISADSLSQIKMCLTELGKEPLEPGIAEQLWKDLVKVG